MLLKIFDSNGVAHPLQDIQDGRIEHIEDGCDKLIFSIDVRHELYPLIVEETVIHYNKNEWLVKKIQDDVIECHLNFDFLKQSILKDYSYQNQRLSTILQAMLPAGWTIIGADANTYFRGKTYVLCTPFEVIYDCIEKYDVRFVWSILEKKLVVKTPSLITSSGVYLSDQLNLTSLAFQGSTAGFITRLYPYGAEGLSVAEINDGKEYIDNNSYNDKIVCAYWVDERYTDKMSLLEAAHEKLASLSIPERSYECKVRDIAKQSSKYSDLTINMHDKITLLVSERKIKVLYSVISYTEYPDDPEANKVTLSCVPDTIQSYTQALVQARVNEAIVVADKALQKIDVVDGKVETLDDRVATAEAKALEIEGKADDAANRAGIAIVGVLSAELRVTEVIKGFSASKSKYFVGTKSPSYGRTYANAVEVMEEGMIYVPTETHTEEFNLNPSFSFDKGFLYSWLSNIWVKGVAVFFGAELPVASVDGSLWFCEQEVTSAGITYGKNSLYKFSLVGEGSGTWIVVASLSDNYVYKNITSLREGIVSITAVLNENSADINLLAAWQTQATTTIAQISQKADANESSINTLVAFMGDTESGAIKAIADVMEKADANESSISSLVAWMGDTESGAIKAIADVTQKASANESSIQSITTWMGNSSSGAIKAIADVTQKATANEASIGLLATWKSGVEDDVSSIASISAKADANGSAIALKADKVTVDGVLTITNGLSSGATTIDGACIKAGIIKSVNYQSLVIEDANPEQQDTWDILYIYHVANEYYPADGYWIYNIPDELWAQNEECPFVPYSGNGMQIFLNTGITKSKNFAIDESGNAYLKGNIDMLSGTIGSGVNKWNIGTSGLYYGINSLIDTTTTDGSYIGIDGIKSRGVTITGGTYPLIEYNDVVLNEGYVKVIHNRDHGELDSGYSEGYLKSNELFLNESYESLYKGIRIYLFGNDVDSAGHIDYVYGSVSSHQSHSMILFSEYSMSIIPKLFLRNNLEVDGSITVSGYNLATKISSIESRLSALEAVG